MTEPEVAPADAGSRPLWLVAQGDDGPLWPEGVESAFARASGFAAKPGQICLLPGEGGVAGALFGIGKPATPADRPARERFTLARAADGPTCRMDSPTSTRHSGCALAFSRAERVSGHT